MSTAGTYQYWSKIQHPNSVLPQMTSDGNLPPILHLPIQRLILTVLDR